MNRLISAFTCLAIAASAQFAEAQCCQQQCVSQPFTCCPQQSWSNYAYAPFGKNTYCCNMGNDGRIYKRQQFRAYSWQAPLFCVRMARSNGYNSGSVSRGSCPSYYNASYNPECASNAVAPASGCCRWEIIRGRLRCTRYCGGPFVSNSSACGSCGGCSSFSTRTCVWICDPPPGGCRLFCY